MRRRPFLPSLLLLLLSCPPSLLAHGGQYRGPGEVVPPSPGATGGGNSGGSNRSTTGGAAPAGGTAGPGAAPTGPAVVAGGAAAARGARRGVPIDDDLSRWEFWWEFGKDPFLRLREAVLGAPRGDLAEDALWNPRLAGRTRDVAAPSEDDRAAVAEQLAKALRAAADRDTASACLVALAKIGRDGVDWTLPGVIRPFLASKDQELRETAALALGIAGRAEADTVALLAALVLDAPAGQQASGGAAVNERTRAFAAYALGLLLHRQPGAAVAHRLVQPLLAVLEAASSRRDLQVAAIAALALLGRRADAPAGAVLRDSVVEALGRFYARPLGAGDELVQAHVPPALANLLVPGSPAARQWQAVFARDLAVSFARGGDAPAAKVNPHVAQSCALALGRLGTPWVDATSPDAGHGALLLDAYHHHRDQQTRSFALLAVARLGGAAARQALLRELAQASRAIEQPWVAVALGVLEARRQQSLPAASRQPDVEVAAALRASFAGAKNPSATSAHAIALGLCQDLGAADALRARLAHESQRDDSAAHLALGLGLLQDRLAVAGIRALLRDSARRPLLMLQTARALGLLGDRDAIDELCAQLDHPQPGLARLSAAAAALGQIGDRRSLPPLQRLLDDARLTPLTRAFAAVALGSVCDKDPLPWNAAYAANCNYRAAVETLTDGAAGILDIL